MPDVLKSGTCPVDNLAIERFHNSHAPGYVGTLLGRPPTDASQTYTIPDLSLIAQWTAACMKIMLKIGTNLSVDLFFVQLIFVQFIFVQRLFARRFSSNPFRPILT